MLKVMSMVYTPDEAPSSSWTIGDKVGFIFEPMVKCCKPHHCEGRHVVGTITRIATDFQTCWVQDGQDEYIGVPLNRLTNPSTKN